MISLEGLAWLILRIGYAWLYLHALVGLLNQWQSTEDMVSLLFPKFTSFFAALMIAVMFVCSISLILGFYAEIAGFFLCFYNLLGMRLHYKLANIVKNFQLSKLADEADREPLQNAAELGYVGHITSAQKNAVLFAVAIFFMILGSGPVSLTQPMWF